MSSENNPFIQLIADHPKIAADRPNPNQPTLDYTHQMVTSDGQEVNIRPIKCDDKNKLKEFHSRLSSNSLYLRYQYFKGELSESDLQMFCNVDYNNTLGLVAEIKKDKQKYIIGVGRYARLNDPQIAEMAFVVQDSEQKKGIGTQLLRHLAVLAWERDIRYFVGELLRENGRMINILQKSVPKMTQLNEGSTCTITIKVEDARDNTPVAWSAATRLCKQKSRGKGGNPTKKLTN
jgi:GNAT superfamily N-acetyltransferase